jgi:hypothetical protein
MAVENFEQILQCINNTEIRIALERLFALCGVGTGSDGASITQNVVGNLTGNVTGDLLGTTVGTHIGDNEGDEIKQLTTYSVDTDLDDTDLPTTMIDLNGSTASADVIKFTPEPGKMYVISCSDVGTADPSITASSGITLDGTNDKATFDAADECLIIFCINATTCLIIENIGGVVLS